MMVDGDNKKQSLFNAVRNNYAVAIEALLLDLADDDKRYLLEETNSMLFDCVEKRENIKAIKILIKHGANLDAIDTSLHLAAEMGNTEVIKTLIEYGANLNQRNKDGKTPLHLAA